MSLGWQTESALLPSKAKKINVDNKSMMSLKAMVHAHEQKREIKSIERGSGYDSVNYTKRKLDQSHAEGRGKNDIFLQKNKGVDNRNRKDDSEIAAIRDGCSTLTAKAELYDVMINSESSMRDFVGGTLVDFASKKRIKSDNDDKSQGHSLEQVTENHERDYGREYECDKMISNFIEEKATVLSSSSKIKTQWDKTMSKETKAFLTEIHAGSTDVSSHAQEQSGTKSAKDLRREKIAAKQRSSSDIILNKTST